MTDPASQTTTCLLNHVPKSHNGFIVLCVHIEGDHMLQLTLRVSQLLHDLQMRHGNLGQDCLETAD